MKHSKAHIQNLWSQITGRATSGQERYVSRWGNQQYYWNDITHPIHLYAGQLKAIVYQLDKELIQTKKQLEEEKKYRKEEVTKIQEKYNDQSRQDMTQRYEFINQMHRTQAKLSTQSEELQAARHKLETMEKETKTKLYASLEPYSCSNSGGLSEEQKSIIEKAINKTVTFGNSNTKYSEQIRTKIKENLKGEWGVMWGLVTGWSCHDASKRWAIFKSNHSTIYIWNENDSAPETEYVFNRSGGTPVTQSEKQYIQNLINQTRAGGEWCLEKTDRIQKDLQKMYSGIWGVAGGLGPSYSLTLPPWEKYLNFKSNRRYITVWKQLAASQAQETEFKYTYSCRNVGVAEEKIKFIEKEVNKQLLGKKQGTHFDGLREKLQKQYGGDWGAAVVKESGDYAFPDLIGCLDFELYFQSNLREAIIWKLKENNSEQTVGQSQQNQVLSAQKNKKTIKPQTGVNLENLFNQEQSPEQQMNQFPNKNEKKSKAQKKMEKKKVNKQSLSKEDQSPSEQTKPQNKLQPSQVVDISKQQQCPFFVLQRGGNAACVYNEVYIRVLLEKRCLPGQKDIEGKLALTVQGLEEKFGGEWGTFTQGPLEQLGTKSGSNQWYLYGSSHMKVLFYQKLNK